MRELQTERLLLRPPIPADELAYLAFATSPRGGAVGGPFSESTGWDRFVALLGHWALLGFGRFVPVEKATCTPIGQAGPNAPRTYPKRELAWTPRTGAAEGHGLAFEATAALRDDIFRDLGWPNAVSWIKARNTQAPAARLRATIDPDAPRPEGLTGDVFRHTPGGRP